MGLSKGQKAPDFTLPSTSGSDFKLSKDFFGKACVIYFYPKDFTGGCTAQACEFRDQFEEFRDLDIPVIGISRDDMETHLRFKKENKLPFELLSDTSGEVCKKYDALVPIIGIPKRITYLLDKGHVIKDEFQDMFNAKAHIKKMLDNY
ncbi:peroxiredoxin [Cyclobacterium qasimii]|uniref:thioredoxin-dependent peroxiredoxin n=2 Tax=Cyclobacterium qasimii TaxID=1350429 RepID=S7VC44_9BACT|nr:peroxiredoxin [Cyclobacterium qasimii]EPR67800.1 Thiol peroxidase, Bcp-type [Cyclobacterium qasimii M12-11B]GEO20389.1 peroxiredoxin [Cyclobacterium qasimii]